MTLAESNDAKFFRFDDITVDGENFRVEKKGLNVILTPRAFDVLAFLIKNRGTIIEKQKIFESVWKDTFVSDNALTKIIKEIRRALEDSADAPRYIETVPKRGYRFIGEVREKSNQNGAEIESQVAVGEETQNGEDKVQPLSRTKQPRFAFSKAALALLLIILFSVTAFLAWLLFRQGGTENASSPIRSIAVLPFVNESGNADIEYLSDGITETLISSLSQIPNLNVKARSSVFRYKGKEANAQTIGRELNVQAILNGRVVQRGEGLILYVELVDTGTENVLWKADYNRSMQNLVSLEIEITRDVSYKLKTKLSGADEQRLAKNQTDNPEAYQLYLKGRFHWNKRRVIDFRKSIEYLEQAIAADPNYALAYAALADAYTLLAEYGGAPPREAIPKARVAALKALSLDDQLAEAHSALALALDNDYDSVGAEREYKRALELNPNDASAHQLYAALLSNLARHDEALGEARRALEIDPLSLINNRSYGDHLFYARKYDESIAQQKKTLDLDANFASVHASLFNVYRQKGNYAASVEEFAKNQELIGEPQTAALIRESFARGGWQGFLRAMTGERRPASFTDYLVATFYTTLGEKDKALAELNQSYETRECFLLHIKVDPRLDPLRDDPRFQDLLRRIGLQP